MQPNLAHVMFCVHYMSFYILLRMHVCFGCVRFNFAVLSQQIGWTQRLQNDLFLFRMGRETLIL